MHMLFKTSQSDRNAAKYALRLYIDVNGDKGPNTFGKDIYVFYVTDDGKVIANGSKKANDLEIDTTYWNSENGCSGDTSGGSGLYCAGRVVEEGYRIKYKF